MFAAVETTSAGFSRLDNFQLVANPVSLFATWIGGYSVGAQDGPNDNPDGDLLTNIQEFAFGSDPSANDSGPLAIDGSVNGAPVPVTSDGTTYELYFIRRDDHGTSGSITYTAQFSSDLQTFTDSGDTPTFVTDSSDDSDYEVVKVPYPPTATFGRIRVEQSP